MAEQSYTQHLLERRETPPWLKKANSGVLTGMIGFQFDATVELLLRGVQSGNFNHPNLTTDGLDRWGSMRGIPRRPGEGNPSYAGRLRNAWEMWRNAGARQMLIEEIEGHLGVTGVKIIATYEWDGVTSDAYFGTYPAWSNPAQLDNWSRFWVYVPHTGHNVLPDGDWDDPGDWDDGGVWDFENLSWQQVQRLRAVIDTYRPAHEVCVRVRFMLEAGSFTDVDTWSGESIALEFLPES